jgi:NitT/TauT family transport system ATP-binding protein
MNSGEVYEGVIRAANLGVEYNKRGTVTRAVEALDFRVRPGEFLCFLGTTGCGKSTTLNVLAGFVRPTTGSVYIGQTPIEGPGPDRGFVFQDHALFLWKTVAGNIDFGPKLRGLPRDERRARVDEYIKVVGLAGFEKSYPNELSGGMRQRVGLARALANDPSVIMMDEPFGSLDAQTRAMMQELLLSVWERTNKTVIFVTHDVDEAMFLADRIIVLTARPARVKEEIDMPLPRPRTYEMVTSSRYVEIKRRVLELIREETFKAMRGAHS